jgi:hypothetical protein
MYQFIEVRIELAYAKTGTGAAFTNITTNKFQNGIPRTLTRTVIGLISSHLADQIKIDVMLIEENERTRNFTKPNNSFIKVHLHSVLSEYREQRLVFYI